MARSHTNHDKLRIGVIQVEKCELPKDFRGPPVRDGVLVRNPTEDGWSGAGCGLLNVVIKCVKLSRQSYALKRTVHTRSGGTTWA